LASADIFPEGKQRRHFAYAFQVADDAMQTVVRKALYPFYAKRNCSILRQESQKMHFIGSNSQAYCDKVKIDYLQIFQAEYCFTK